MDSLPICLLHVGTAMMNPVSPRHAYFPHIGEERAIKMLMPKLPMLSRIAIG